MKMTLISRRVVDDDQDNPYIRCKYLFPGLYVVMISLIDGKVMAEAEGIKKTPQPGIVIMEGKCLMALKEGYPARESQAVAKNVLEAEKFAEFLTENIKRLIANEEKELEIPGFPDNKTVMK